MMNRIISYLSFSLLILIFACNSAPKKLPILGTREAVEKIIDGKTIIDTVYQSLPNFSFINQDSVIINSDSLNGKIYVADFFFTTCPSICPIMSKHMLSIYKKYEGNDEIKFLSHTIDPKHDTIPVLKKYADKLGVNGKQWYFLLGDKDEVYKLAKEGYMSFAAQDSTVPGGITHSGYFLLVDKEKRIRGAYDGTDETQVNQLMKDMDVLLSEYKSLKK
jgi:protein SCO1/2